MILTIRFGLEMVIRSSPKAKSSFPSFMPRIVSAPWCRLSKVENVENPRKQCVARPAIFPVPQTESGNSRKCDQKERESAPNKLAQ